MVKKKHFRVKYALKIVMWTYEIIKEGYFGNTTTYTGWLWEDGKAPVSAIMYIWNSGDMVYRVEK